MRPNKHVAKQKIALATHRKLNELYDQKWKDHGVPCTPFQHGWIRDYVLRPDVARRDDAQDLQAILNVIGGDQWSKTKEFLGYSSRGAKPPLPPPPLRTINVRRELWGSEFRETGWPKELPPSFKKWFYYHGINAPFCNCFSKQQYYRPAHYTFRTPWMFDLRIRPAFISSLPYVNGDVETQIAELNRRMKLQQYGPVLIQLCGHHHHGRDPAADKCRRLEKLIDEETRKILETEQ